jgi:ABC-type sugar transport system ATPase subunit
MANIELKGLSKSYGHHIVLDALDLSIANGEFVTIVGPSGCGKSTLLRMIAGLDSISSGQLFFDGKTVNDVAPKERGVAMVFQSYALYPHLSVYDNVAFGLKGRMPKPAIQEKVLDVLDRLQLSKLAKRLPKQLSGGQRQRVAIARAISREPGVMLFDEPLSNLDAGLRNQTRLEIARLHRAVGSTTIYVTHDQAEAMTLSDKIVLLNAGRIEQFGSPLDVYRKPANRFVAEFIGSPKINILQKNEALSLFAGMPAAHSIGSFEKVVLGLRAHELETVPAGNATLKARVSVIEEYGDRAYIYVETEGAGTALVMEMTGMEDVKVGDIVGLAPRVPQPLVFDEQSGTRLEQGIAA